MYTCPKFRQDRKMETELGLTMPHCGILSITGSLSFCLFLEGTHALCQKQNKTKNCINKLANLSITTLLGLIKLERISSYFALAKLLPCMENIIKISPDFFYT